MARIRVGISGWRYPPWRGVFYPPKLAQRLELSFASAQFDTIELNGSFYSLQRPECYAQWHDQTPRDFVFAVKGGRFITHMKRLRDIEVPLANFFASGILALGTKLGPILWQFPAQFAYDEARFEAFFELLPKSSLAAAALAERHDQRLIGRALTTPRARTRIRHAVEVRHTSFCRPEFLAQLRRHRVGLVVADTAHRWPDMEDITADFVYVRLHGDEELYVSGYSDSALDRWAIRIAAWRAGTQVEDAKRVDKAHRLVRKPRDVYVYFDNDVKVRAPFDARSLASRLGTGPDDGRFTADPSVASSITEAPRTSWPSTRSRRVPKTARKRPR